MSDPHEKTGKEAREHQPRHPGCRFGSPAGRCVVSYKDVRTLQKLITPQGKLYSRKRSGACAQCQRKIKKAVKRARFLALLPFVGR